MHLSRLLPPSRIHFMIVIYKFWSKHNKLCHKCYVSCWKPIKIGHNAQKTWQIEDTFKIENHKKYLYISFFLTKINVSDLWPYRFDHIICRNNVALMFSQGQFQETHNFTDFSDFKHLQTSLFTFFGQWLVKASPEPFVAVVDIPVACSNSTWWAAVVVAVAPSSIPSKLIPLSESDPEGSCNKDKMNIMLSYY